MVSPTLSKLIRIPSPSASAEGGFGFHRCLILKPFLNAFRLPPLTQIHFIMLRRHRSAEDSGLPEPLSGYPALGEQIAENLIEWLDELDIPLTPKGRPRLLYDRHGKSQAKEMYQAHATARLHLQSAKDLFISGKSLDALLLYSSHLRQELATVPPMSRQAKQSPALKECILQLLCVLLHLYPAPSTDEFFEANSAKYRTSWIRRLTLDYIHYLVHIIPHLLDHTETGMLFLARNLSYYLLLRPGSADGPFAAQDASVLVFNKLRACLGEDHPETLLALKDMTESFLVGKMLYGPYRSDFAWEIQLAGDLDYPDDDKISVGLGSEGPEVLRDPRGLRNLETLSLSSDSSPSEDSITQRQPNHQDQGIIPTWQEMHQLCLRHGQHLVASTGENSRPYLRFLHGLASAHLAYDTTPEEAINSAFPLLRDLFSRRESVFAETHSETLTFIDDLLRTYCEDSAVKHRRSSKVDYTDLEATAEELDCVLLDELLELCLDSEAYDEVDDLLAECRIACVEGNPTTKASLNEVFEDWSQFELKEGCRVQPRLASFKSPGGSFYWEDSRMYMRKWGRVEVVTADKPETPWERLPTKILVTEAGMELKLPDEGGDGHGDRPGETETDRIRRSEIWKLLDAKRMAKDWKILMAWDWQHKNSEVCKIVEGLANHEFFVFDDVVAPCRESQDSVRFAPSIIVSCSLTPY